MSDTAPPLYVVPDHVDTKVASTEHPDARNKKAFEDISILLDILNRRKFTTEDNQDIAALRPAWDTLRESYRVLLSKSNSDAIRMKAICDDCNVNVPSRLKDEGLDMGQLKVEIREFQARTETAAKGAEDNSDSFDKLLDHVKQCKAAIVDREQLANDISGFATIMTQLRALTAFWKCTFVNLNSLVHVLREASDDSAPRIVLKPLGDELGRGLLLLSELLGQYISQLSKLD
ncbi:hypothetical protein B0H13DRAFT_2369983 [Mycena leptocephala]|nr:hypothetical protein B0H13DRAFT_2369983 [Mycena leptocephala]